MLEILLILLTLLFVVQLFFVGKALVFRRIKHFFD